MKYAPRQFKFATFGLKLLIVPETLTKTLQEFQQTLLSYQ